MAAWRLILLGQVREQSQVRQRPRLLISNTDPFTGLALLKTRYASGMRPSEDMEGWALSWQLTREDSFAEKAAGRDARRPHHQGGEAFAFLG